MIVDDLLSNKIKIKYYLIVAMAEATTKTFNGQGGFVVSLSQTSESVDLHESLIEIKEDYFRTISTETAFKKALLENEAQKARDTFVRTLDETYRELTAYVETTMTQKKDLLWGQSKLAWSGSSGTKTSAVSQQASSAAVQCVKRELQKKGWAPNVCEECVIDTNGGVVWKITIVCSFQSI